MRTVKLPGRFQRVDRWIFDVAHNLDGVKTLAASLASVALERPFAALVCILGDKDWRAMIDALASSVDMFVFTDAPTAPPSRAWPLADALAYAREKGHRAEASHEFDVALRMAEAEGRTVLVTGSFHTVGDAMARLQVSPLSG